MRKFYLFAAAAVLLAACVKTQTVDEVTPIGVNESAVNFDVYTSRATKAGKPQVITTDSLKKGPGFGVFAYYTNNGKYDQYVKPNFMYNQQVKWDKVGENWVYEPVKYWPNETGDAAISDDLDYVSFFAYAPFVETNPSTGAVLVPEHLKNKLDPAEHQQKNITGIINNSTMGDPKIKYVVDFNPATSVDLLWGVQSAGDDKGLPFLDQLKPKTTDKMSFNLQHALAKLNVQIDAKVDGDTNVDDSTRIYIRSITFEGFATKGTLNLNNSKPNEPVWLDYTGINNLVAEPVTIFDGRKDGKEGFKDGEAAREKVLGIDSLLVQAAPYTDPTKVTPGVTKDPVNLFTPIDRSAATAASDPIFVIPNGDPVKITIVYDVETQDCKLAGYLSDGVTHGSSIENTITKYLKLPGDTKDLVMYSGYNHIFRLHLGMTSVKVEAEVYPWVNFNDHDLDVNLPANNS